MSSSDPDATASNNPLQQLFQSLLQEHQRYINGFQTGTTSSNKKSTSRSGGGAAADVRPPRPYRLLIPHAHGSFAVRHAAAATLGTKTTTVKDSKSRNHTQKSNQKLTDDDASVYRRAGLLTPAEAATLTLQAGPLWPRLLVEHALSATRIAPSSKENTKGRVHMRRVNAATSNRNNNPSAFSTTTSNTVVVLWLRTVPRPHTWLDQLARHYGPSCIRIIDCCGAGDPLGWDCDDEDDDARDNSDNNNNRHTATTPSLERLDSIVAAVQREWAAVSANRATTTTTATSSPSPPMAVVCVDTLGPLIQRHGMHRTTAFLQQLQDVSSSALSSSTSSSATSGMVVVAALVPTLPLTAAQNRHLQADSDGVLHVSGPNGVELIRRGVRDRASVVRETLAVRIEAVTDMEHVVVEVGGSSLVPERRIVIRTAGEDVRQDEDGRDNTFVQPDPSQAAEKDTSEIAAAVPFSSHGSASKKREKVLLQVNDGGRDESSASTGLPQPRIFMQDDDPEFDDYDEEDPDDDLDL